MPERYYALFLWEICLLMCKSCLWVGAVQDKMLLGMLKSLGNLPAEVQMSLIDRLGIDKKSISQLKPEEAASLYMTLVEKALGDKSVDSKKKVNSFYMKMSIDQMRAANGQVAIRYGQLTDAKSKDDLLSTMPLLQSEFVTHLFH